MSLLEGFFVYYWCGLFICAFLDVITKSKFELIEFIIALFWPALPAMFYFAAKRLKNERNKE